MAQRIYKYPLLEIDSQQIVHYLVSVREFLSVLIAVIYAYNDAV